jgi:hypothetical protein
MSFNAEELKDRAEELCTLCNRAIVVYLKRCSEASQDRARQNELAVTRRSRPISSNQVLLDSEECTLRVEEEEEETEEEAVEEQDGEEEVKDGEEEEEREEEDDGDEEEEEEDDGEESEDDGDEEEEEEDDGEESEDDAEEAEEDVGEDEEDDAEEGQEAEEEADEEDDAEEGQEAEEEADEEDDAEEGQEGEGEGEGEDEAEEEADETEEGKEREEEGEEGGEEEDDEGGREKEMEEAEEDQEDTSQDEDERDESAGKKADQEDEDDEYLKSSDEDQTPIQPAGRRQSPKFKISRPFGKSEVVIKRLIKSMQASAIKETQRAKEYDRFVNSVKPLITGVYKRRFIDSKVQMNERLNPPPNYLKFVKLFKSKSENPSDFTLDYLISELKEKDVYAPFQKFLEHAIHLRNKRDAKAFYESMCSNSLVVRGMSPEDVSKDPTIFDIDYEKLDGAVNTAIKALYQRRESKLAEDAGQLATMETRLPEDSRFDSFDTGESRRISQDALARAADMQLTRKIVGGHASPKKKKRDTSHHRG